MNKSNLIMTAFNNAVKEIQYDKICMVSDIYWDPLLIPNGIDFFHTPRGRAIPFSAGLKLGNPKLKVAVFIGDLATIGGNHLMHAARRNIEILVICINNFIYKEIGNFSPEKFSCYSESERPFNIPHLAKSCGSIYVARWTALHTKELTNTIVEAFNKSGLSVIEVMSPGANYFAGIENSTKESEILKYYYENSEIKNNEETNNLDIKSGKKIIVGKFVDRKRMKFIDSYNAQLSRILGDKFKRYG
ncbi:MAG: 2-oxoacid:ferredoxin oxidoreductase subunit beta [Deltaproteobacteria bacterium]|nr:2-oxoacid:ferredoxin oxidoreductase subunit beta [Candidatus Aminicenantes bacterium]RLA95457.1 MAG: 2-oxoacid:ferredoxin oxidoreductase subunit beta [Deltaproteobacteria bacterium]